MNIYKFELKAYRRMTMVWTVSLCALTVLMLLMFPAYAESATLVEEILSGFPEEIRLAIGLSIENITTLLGFFSFVFGYIMLCAAVQGMNIGLSIFAKEFSQKTADFLLTKPVKRQVTMTSKLLAASTSLFITTIGVAIVSVIMCNVVKNESYSMKSLLLICGSMFLVQMIFMFLGVLIAVIIPKIKAILSVSMGVVFTFFLISMLATTFEDDWMRFVSPFSYFSSAYIVQNEAYETPFLLATFLISAISLCLSYQVFVKKDVHTI